MPMPALYKYEGRKQMKKRSSDCAETAETKVSWS